MLGWNERLSLNIVILLRLSCPADRPDPPQGKPQVSEVTEDSARIEWQAPTHDGGAMIMSFTVEKRENSQETWMRCGITHLNRLVARDLKPGKEYRFRVLAENIYGVSDPSEDTDPIVTQQTKLDIDYDRLGMETIHN